MQINIRSRSLEELQIQLKTWEEPSFRAQQIYDWLWKTHAPSFDQMSNLSKKLREKLKENYSFPRLKIHSQQKSADGTLKFIFELFDGNKVEGVLIPTASRMTACISCQVGCSLTCAFCATGKLGRMRNLTAEEIYDQVVLIGQKAMENYQIPLSNIVYMGMGEPLLNYKPVLASIEKITTAQGLGMSPSRITVSTAGIAKMIQKLGDDDVRFNLALSLHAANDAKRSQIMPINEANDLENLQEALNYFYAKTKNRVTFEYIIFKDFNDSLKDAEELVRFCRKTPSKVNIIEYNSIGLKEFQQADPEKVDAFLAHLERNGVSATLRRSRGKDIDAACGQLAGKNK
jgi:23S rRNA (adenine2503-C2)-methyltransferase